MKEGSLEREKDMIEPFLKKRGEKRVSYLSVVLKSTVCLLIARVVEGN